MISKESVAEAMERLQDRICAGLESLDGEAKFVQDLWTRAEGGGGRTRILNGGNLIEKGGVNFSRVFGNVTPAMKQATDIKGDEFFATGVSIVLHPNNPHVPIIHMNVRYFETSEGEYWFGGGIDLTPHFIIERKAGQFHSGLKNLCDQYDPSFYEKFKKWADDYFFLPHRNETRGVGGVFFDHLSEKNALSKESLLNFCIDLGDRFVPLYTEQVEEFRSLPYTQEEKDWMNLRRGRYVEFNLAFDRGTKFGLYSGGRTESILMSLPANASWLYNYEPKKNSKEAKTLELLKKDINWLSHWS